MRCNNSPGNSTKFQCIRNFCMTCSCIAAELKLSGKLFVDRPESCSATHVKTVYLLRRKSCARFGLNFSIFFIYPVKNPR